MKLSFRQKLLMPLLVCWVCLWATTLTALFHTKSMRHEERQLALKAATEIALSVTQEYADQVQKGVLSKENAQAQARQRIKAIRFGSDGYLTILSSDARTVMHPIKPELEGKDMSDFKDPAGNFPFRDMARIAKTTGSGWVEYVWPKPGHPDQSKFFPKGSYVTTYKPWDWSFVAGVYLDDLTDILVRDFWRAFAILAIIGIALNGSIFLVIRSVERSVGGDPDDAADVAKRIAAGNVADPVKTKPGDQSSLLFAMKTMQESLNGLVAKVRISSDSITTASSELAAGNLDLSSRTEEQAASLEETASSMDEITSTVKQTADNARQAHQLAAEACRSAGKGGQAVGEVVGTMAEINASASKIVDIIGVIDGIAFQTNILALNAAVEAARAGEQGKGFAVVAAEVRNLAQRSAMAAKEIKTLIGDSIDKVHAGTQLVSQAGATVSEVVVSVKRVSDLIGEIAAASQEQAAGIEQVNRAIAQMDQVTQQNAALVEEAAAVSDSMARQAQHLAKNVAVFKIENGTLDGTAPVPVPAPRTGQKSAPRPAVRPVSSSAVASRAPARKLPAAMQAEGWEDF